jgi:hypothetical protein
VCKYCVHIVTAAFARVCIICIVYSPISRSSTARMLIINVQYCSYCRIASCIKSYVKLKMPCMHRNHLASCIYASFKCNHIVLQQCTWLLYSLNAVNYTQVMCCKHCYSQLHKHVVLLFMLSNTALYACYAIHTHTTLHARYQRTRAKNITRFLLQAF